MCIRDRSATEVIKELINIQDPKNPNEAIAKQNNNHNHPGPQNDVKIHKNIATEPVTVKINKYFWVLPSLSAISPSIGPTITSVNADIAPANAHNDDPVKLNPNTSTESPNEALNKLTK